MKKMMTLCMALLIGTSIVGCSHTQEEMSIDKMDLGKSDGLIEENDFNNLGFSSSGMFWTYQFNEMTIQTNFIQDNPKDYFIDRDMLATDIKSLEVKPDVTKQNQWFYIIYKDGKYQVDEADLKAYGDKGRTEAFNTFNQKLKEFNLTLEDIGNFTVNYFNQTIRVDLLNVAQSLMQDLATKIQKTGYTIDRDNSQRVIISRSGQPFKIVVVTKQVMVVSAEMDLSGDKKTGYMYIPSQGTGGYINNDETELTYRYNDNVLIEGSPSTDQYTEINEMKEWYDNFMSTFETDIGILQLIQ